VKKSPQGRRDSASGSSVRKYRPTGKKSNSKIDQQREDERRGHGGEAVVKQGPLRQGGRRPKGGEGGRPNGRC